MNTLAFVVFIVASGPHEGMEIIPAGPIPCEENVEDMRENFAALGLKTDAFCHYTAAPLSSIRPRSRNH